MKGRPGDAVALFSIYEHQIPREKSRGGIVRGIIMYYRLFRMAAYSLSFFWKRIQRKSYFVVEGLEKYCCLKLLLHKNCKQLDAVDWELTQLGLIPKAQNCPSESPQGRGGVTESRQEGTTTTRAACTSYSAFMLVVDSYSLMRRKLACPGSCGATSIRTAPGGTELARDGRGSADRQPNRCHVLHVSYQPATYD
ncbi:hypothetical protein MUK42_36890 [Musa troglodytarum]|uniref:Uncharacterized protein n=1 Tax=Musa troglodytarum TaxID=320322 RepID=A0A9E7HDJ6_9LILI|nr:hypothetical protein MUK42_36890 [Musa troglodytarum]